MPTIAEIEKNTAEWSKQYTQDGRLVYVNKKTGKKISRKPSIEERALEIAMRNRSDQSSPSTPDPTTTGDRENGDIATNTTENVYVQQYTIDRTPFYMHLYSGEVMWFLPRGTPESAVKFITHITESGVPYYENVEKKSTTWTLPLEKMTSLARRNATNYRKYSRPQVEDKLHITFEDARKESYLANSNKKIPGGGGRLGSPSPDSMTMKKSKKSNDKKSPSKYHNIASVDFNNITLSEKTAAAQNESSKVEGIFGSGQERGKPLVRIVFERYDRNKDGFIDAAELQDLCYDFGSFLLEDELRSAIDRFDTSSTGSLNYIDFIVWWRNTETFSDLKITDGDVRQRSAAAEIFKRYDDQRVGYITRHQFRPLYAELVAAGLTTLTLEKCMGDLDSNHDGIIQFNEFIVWLDTSRKEWEGSSKNVARKLSTFKSSGPTLKKLFGDLMTSNDEGSSEEPETVVVKDHPEYAKYFRMLAVGGDVRDIMPHMKEAGLDASLLQTPNMVIPLHHRAPNGSPEVSKEAQFTNLFKKKKEVELPSHDPPPAPVENSSSNLFTFDPAHYIYTSIPKPLGLSLGENVPECAMGVFVESCAPGGKAEATGLLYPGLVLITACGVDVQAYDFDSVMDILRNAPSDEPVDLVFADPTMAILNEEPPAVPDTDGAYFSEEEYAKYAVDNIYSPEHNTYGEPEHNGMSVVTSHDSFISAGGDDPFAEPQEDLRVETDDSFNELLEAKREDEETKQQEKQKTSFSSKGAAAAVLKATARRKLEARSSESDCESSPVVTNRKGFPPVPAIPSPAVATPDRDDEVPPPVVNSSDKPPVITRVSSLRRGRNNLKDALRMESTDRIEALPTTFSTSNIADSPSLQKQESASLDVAGIMGRAKAPPKRAPSDIRDEPTAKPPLSDYPSAPPPPKPSLDILDDADDDVPYSPPTKMTVNPMFKLPGMKATTPKKPDTQSAAALTFSDNLVKASPTRNVASTLPMPPPPRPSPLSVPSAFKTAAVYEEEPYIPASTVVVIEEQSDFNPVSKKPMSVFSYGGTAAPSHVIDPYLREKYGGVPLTPPDGMDETEDIFNDFDEKMGVTSIGCQTDYSAYMDAEYQTSYQMLLGEKAEVQAILSRVRAEELAANARIQRAEDDSFRRCQERELYLSEMLALEEQKAMERIEQEEEKLAANRLELEAAWEKLRAAEMVAKEFHNNKMNDLINIAGGLAQHHKKLLDDKRKVGKQRLSLDLAMRDINNYTHFSPFGQTNPAQMENTYTMRNARASYNPQSTRMAPPRQYPQSEGRPVQSAYQTPQGYYSQQKPLPGRNHIPGQVRQPSRPSPASNNSKSATASSRSKSASRSRQIDYRNL